MWRVLSFEQSCIQKLKGYAAFIIRPSTTFGYTSEVYDKNIYEIEIGKCYAVSSAHAIESARGGIALNSKEMYGLNKSISEFYQQQRDERVNLWRDVSRLRLQLPENAQQYLSAYRKVSILEDDEGDAV